MTADNLLDAIGMVDDSFLTEQRRGRPVWRFLVALAAAVALLALSVGTAMAVNEGFREAVFSIFRIGTTETPPVELPTEDLAPGLREMDVMDLEDQVTARYFAKNGVIQTVAGGLYTCDYDTHEDPAFWEIGVEGITEIAATRLDFPLEYGGRTIRILLDYGVINGKLAIRVWPQGLNEDPVGNGWNVVPIGDRLDAALLSIPVLENDHYNFHFLFLDLKTLETRVLLATETPLDHAWFSSDLKYAIGVHWGEYWFYDLEQGTSASFGQAREPYFMDDETIICKVPGSGEAFDVVRYHIPSGTSRVLLYDASRKVGYRGIGWNGAEGTWGLLYDGSGSMEAVDYRTGERLSLTGLDALDTGSLRTDESPNGSRILIAWEQTNGEGALGYGFTSLGLLDPETGVLKLLRRDVSGNEESFIGWIDDHTVVIIAHGEDGKSCWVYAYRFE